MNISSVGNYFDFILITLTLVCAVSYCVLISHRLWPRIFRGVSFAAHRSWIEGLLLCVFVGGLVHFGATKGTRSGGDLNGFFAPPIASDLRSEGGRDLFEPYTNAVTNLCATGIKVAETSVFLRAHWPHNLYPAPTGIEVYATPLLTNAWVDVGRASVVDSDNSAVIELPYSLLPEGGATSMFFMLGFDMDTDQDGLSDSFERIVSKTDPNLADTDGDGMPDGWEIENELNPCGDDSLSDWDDDGLPNVWEYRNGTRANNPDTDDDGLSDGQEGAWIEPMRNYFGLTQESEWGFYLFESQLDQGLVVDPLPFEGKLAGRLVTMAVADVNGVVYFGSPATTNGIESYDSSRVDLLSRPNGNCSLIAGYWSDLVMRSRQASSNWSSIMTSISTDVNCNRYYTMYYASFGTASRTTDDLIFLIALPENNDENIVYVQYLQISDLRTSGWVTIGAQGPAQANGTRGARLSYYSAETPPSLHEILSYPAIKFHLGSGTDPLHSDSDRDGLPDGWEVANGLDPCVALDAAADADNDGVDNLTEYLLGANPYLQDSDGDGLTDGEEMVGGTSLTKVDTDCDGLEDGLEFSIGTNPRQPDTDGDGMDDGWEWTYCRRAIVARLLAGDRDTPPPDFDPIVHNDMDADERNNFNADPDLDGLSNGVECENRTNPTNPDTDGDGVSDGDEVEQGSDPSDATDEGRPNSRVSVQFTFGDPSGSHSEKYRLDVMPISGQGERPASFSWLNANYGACETKTARLKSGWKYEVRLSWVACNQPSDGSHYPNYDYTLNLGQDTPASVVLDDPGSIFRSDYYGGEYYGASHFPILDTAATITVYKVTNVAICNPGDQSWNELDDSRVVLDDEELHIKVEIAPEVKSLAQCRQMFGGTVIVKTSGTCPSGVSVPIGDDASMNNSAGKSEIRITKTRQQLISLGLLPERNEDGVNEMAWLDMASGSGQSLADSEAFAGLGYADRGTASTVDSMRTLDSTPPNSQPSESYFKAAGREIVMVDYGSMTSERRQLMNQADVFYFSGHGSHDGNSIQGGFIPAMAREYWNRDLDIAIIAGCSVLDINDYNDNFSGISHTLSPGKVWEQTGPNVLLGYAYIAPGDAGGAPTRIINQWRINRSVSGDVNAWMDANEANHAWNACAIVKGQKYVYFKKVFFKKFKKVQEVSKGEW